MYKDLPSDWDFKKISDLDPNKDTVITGPFGSLLHAYDYADEGVPLLLVRNIADGRIINKDIPKVNQKKANELKRFWLKEGDIVFTRVGAVGRTLYITSKEDGWMFSGQTLRIRIRNNEINNRFIEYFLRSPIAKNISETTSLGTTRPSINTSILANRYVPVPPKKEQDAIAYVLKSLDDKIELNRQMNETLEAMAKAIFKSWFVDFDPVLAKMEGRKPFGMDEETAALFPDEFEDSELGEIPKGWEIKYLPDIIEINPKRSLSKGQMAPYLEMKNMPNKGHRPETWIYRNFKGGTKFMNGDTLLASITPCLENGKTAFVDFLEDSQIGWGSTEYIILRPKPPMPLEFGYYLARSNEFRNYAISNMTGTSGRQRVPPNCFNNYSLVIPKEEISLKFGEIVNRFMNLIRTNSKQSHNLGSIRDTLLPKLISGQIRIRDAEKFLKERGLGDMPA